MFKQYYVLDIQDSSIPKVIHNMLWAEGVGRELSNNSMIELDIYDMLYNLSDNKKAYETQQGRNADRDEPNWDTACKLFKEWCDTNIPTDCTEIIVKFWW